MRNNQEKLFEWEYSVKTGFKNLPLPLSPPKNQYHFSNLRWPSRKHKSNLFLITTNTKYPGFSFIFFFSNFILFLNFT